MCFFYYNLLTTHKIEKIPAKVQIEEKLTINQKINIP